MKSVDEQITDVLNILKVQGQLNPVGEPIQLQTSLFKECPNYVPILEKLEKEFRCIEINQRPDERGLSDPDHGMFELEQPRNYKRYMSYYITLDKSFDTFYEFHLGEMNKPQDNVGFTSLDDNTAKIITIIGKSFNENDGQPIEITLANLEKQGMSYEEANSVMEGLVEKNIIMLQSRPKSSKDKESFVLVLSDEQKEQQKAVKERLAYLRDLQMLMIYWGKICTIYDSFHGRYSSFEDGKLNRVYLIVLIRADRLLEKDEFSDFKELKPDVYDTFLGNLEDLDIAYEFMRPKIWEFYGLIEKRVVEELEGIGYFNLEPEEQKLLDDIDEAVEEHNKAQANNDERLMKQLENVKPLFDEQASKPKSDSKKAKPQKAKIELHKLEPKHYEQAKGVLHVSPTDKIKIIRHKSVKRPGSNEKYAECQLMEKLFKSVKSLNSGISFSQALGVHEQKIGQKEVKNLRNYASAINKKVSEEGGPRNLVLVRNGHVQINSSYL